MATALYSGCNKPKGPGKSLTTTGLDYVLWGVHIAKETTDRDLTDFDWCITEQSGTFPVGWVKQLQGYFSSPLDRMLVHRSHGYPQQYSHQQIDMNCKGSQTNMPQNVGSKEDLSSQNIQSRHIEFCKADHTETEQGLYLRFGFFRCRVDVLQSWHVVRSALQNLMCHQQALVQLVARRRRKVP